MLPFITKRHYIWTTTNKIIRLVDPWEHFPVHTHWNKAGKRWKQSKIRFIFLIFDRSPYLLINEQAYGIVLVDKEEIEMRTENIWERFMIPMRFAGLHKAEEETELLLLLGHACTQSTFPSLSSHCWQYTFGKYRKNSSQNSLSKQLCLVCLCKLRWCRRNFQWNRPGNTTARLAEQSGVNSNNKHLQSKKLITQVCPEDCTERKRM